MSPAVWSAGFVKRLRSKASRSRASILCWRSTRSGSKTGWRGGSETVSTEFSRRMAEAFCPAIPAALRFLFSWFEPLATDSVFLTACFEDSVSRPSSRCRARSRMRRRRSRAARRCLPLIASSSLKLRNGFRAANFAHALEKLLVGADGARKIDGGLAAVGVNQLKGDAATPGPAREQRVEAIENIGVDRAAIHAHAKDARTVRGGLLGDAFERARIGDDQPRPNIFHRNARLHQQRCGCLQDGLEFLKRFGKNQSLDHAGAVLKREDRPAAALPRAHGPRLDDDAGNREVFAIAPAFKGRQLDRLPFLQATGVLVERMPGNVKAENGIFRGEKFVLRPFGDVGERLRFERGSSGGGRRSSEEAVLADFARVLQFLRAFHGGISGVDHLRAVGAKAVERSRANQAFHDSLVEQARIHGLAELEEALESSQ